MTKFLFEELAFSDNYRRSPSKSIMLAIMFFSGIMVLGYLIDLRSLQVNFFAQRHHYLLLQQQLSDMQHQTVNLSNAHVELGKLQATYNILNKSMATNTNSQILLKNILQAGTISGIQINMIKPQPILQQNFYSILPITLTITGNYPQLTEFIKLLNQLQILMTFPDFTLTHTNTHLSTAMNSAPNNSDKLVLNMTLNVFLSRP